MKGRGLDNKSLGPSIMSIFSYYIAHHLMLGGLNYNICRHQFYGNFSKEKLPFGFKLNG